MQRNLMPKISMYCIVMIGAGISMLIKEAVDCLFL